LASEARRFLPFVIVAAVLVAADAAAHFANDSGGTKAASGLLQPFGLPSLDRLLLFGIPLGAVGRWVYFRVTDKGLAVAAMVATSTIWLSRTKNTPVEAPPVTYPIPGDSTSLEYVGYDPDTDVVRVNSAYERLIRLKNASDTVTWKDRWLCRVDSSRLITSNECFRVRDLAPGESDTVRIQLTAPSSPGFAKVRFRLMDSAHRVYFPAHGPARADARVRL
jgi:hypothetical protein